MIRRFFAGSILGLGILGLGCSDDPASNGGTGGAANTGGGLGTGGVTNTGGLPGVGGEVGSGGVPGTGGAGAAPGTGGSGPATGGGGGVPGTGGVSGDGGTPGGGGGSGGEVTTDGDPIPKPSLITSAAGAFWKTDVEPTMGGTTATITVNPDMELQDWIGWGGTFNEVGWNELMKLDAAERDAVMKLLDELHADGATICMVTHDPRFAECAKRRIAMFDGQVVDEETLEELRTSDDLRAGVN